MTDRPNIVFLLNDHQAYYRHGWDGGARALRPNFDRLAAAGTSFNNAYCASPLCGPSRRTMLTGLFPHTHKNYYNYSEAPYDHDVYLNNLVDAGYRSYYYGKWHAGPGTALDHQCEGFNYTKYGNPYITPEYKQYLKERGLPEAEFLVERCFFNDAMRQQFPNLRAGARYKCDSFWCGENATGVMLTPKETHESYFLANLACDQLDQLARKKDNQPFALRVDFWGPHPPYFATPEFNALYHPEDIVEYGSFRDNLANRPDVYVPVMEPVGDRTGRLIVPHVLPLHEWQQIMVRNYAQISLMDAAGGLILDKLDELGLAENTMVIWTTDHGDAVFSHGGLWDKGSYMTEEVMRVPMAIRFPQQIKPQPARDELVSLIDLVPTMLDAAGATARNVMHGTSLLPLVRGDQIEWRTDLMSESYGHGWGNHQIARMLVNGRYKYVAYQTDLHELYDLTQDPYEMNNLYGKPEVPDIVAEMQVRLRRWQDQTQDPEQVIAND